MRAPELLMLRMPAEEQTSADRPFPGTSVLRPRRGSAAWSIRLKCSIPGTKMANKNNAQSYNQRLLFCPALLSACLRCVNIIINVDDSFPSDEGDAGC